MTQAHRIQMQILRVLLSLGTTNLARVLTLAFA
jgi:hypothetical protein